MAKMVVKPFDKAKRERMKRDWERKQQEGPANVTTGLRSGFNRARETEVGIGKPTKRKK